jgi:uncharacterized membrane protein
MEVGSQTKHPSWTYVRYWPNSIIHHQFGKVNRKNDGRWNWWVSNNHWNRWNYRQHVEQGVAATLEEAQQHVEDIVATLAPKENKHD